MPETITQNDAVYAANIVKTICETVGPGLPGTVQERERAQIIADELETHLGADHVSIEEFTFAPGSFLGFHYLGAPFTLLAVLLNIAAGSLHPRFPAAVAAAAAVVFALIPVLVFIFQFILAREVIDPLFPKKPSVNVIGVLRRPGTQTVKRLLILGGHHDSAWEDNLLRWFGYGFYFASTTLILGLIAMLVISLIQLTGLIAGSAAVTRAGTLGWGLLVYPIGPSLVFGLFWHRAGKGGGNVPGAVDNLSASALAVAMGRFLAQHPAYIPEDTEIRFISFGSEEAGLRGSRRYVKRHLAELKRLDARLLNVEMVGHPEIAIMTSDKNGTVKNDPRMVESLAAAARRAGVPFKVKAASLGTGTDAAPFSQAGLKAAALIPFQFPQQFVAFYHQRTDTPDRLSIEPLENVLKLMLEWIRCGGE